MRTRLITIEVANFDEAQLNIDTLQKVINKQPLTVADEVRLVDTLSLLRAIQRSVEVGA